MSININAKNCSLYSNNLSVESNQNVESKRKSVESTPSRKKRGVQNFTKSV